LHWLPLAARTTPLYTQQGDSHDSGAVYRPSVATREGVSLLAHLHPSSLGISSRRARVRRTFCTRHRARVNPNPNPIIDAVSWFHQAAPGEPFAMAACLLFVLPLLVLLFFFSSSVFCFFFFVFFVFFCFAAARKSFRESVVTTVSLNNRLSVLI